MSDSYPMQVVLLEENHFIRSIWLPAEKEGRYSFEHEDSEYEIPIYITSMNENWLVSIGNDGFILEEESKKSTFILKDKYLLKVFIGDKVFSLYAELKHPGEDVYLPYYIEENTDIKIGRLEDSDICYPNQYVSKDHALLHWENDCWSIIDTNSKNGVFLNGYSVKASRLSIGDVIYIMGLSIIMGKGYIGINNATGRMKTTSKKVRVINSIREISFATCEEYEEDIIFDRKPRRKYQIEQKQIDIEMPPMSMSNNKIPLLLRMGNPLISGGRAILTGNVLSSISSMLLPILTQGLTEKDRKEYEKRREVKYREYLEEKELEIKNEIKNEKKLLFDIYPDLNTLLSFTLDKSRLWERRKFDEDFLSIRIGYGRIPMCAEKKYQNKRFELDQDKLVDEMYKLAEHPSFVQDAPIMLSLKTDYISSILGDYTNTINLVRNIIVQLAITHAYDEVKIIAIMNDSDIELFNYIKYLPHCWNNERTFRFIATTKADSQQLSKYLNETLSVFFDEKTFNDKTKSLKALPSYVVLATNKELFDSIEIFKKTIQSEEYSNVSIITAFEGAPKECSKLIAFNATNSVIDLKNPSIVEQEFNLDSVSTKRINDGMREVMKTKLRIDSQTNASLPNMISFLELYGVGRVEHLVPLKKWAENNPVNSLAAPIGVGTDGKPFVLDLHEKRQGPHQYH